MGQCTLGGSVQSGKKFNALKVASIPDQVKCNCGEFWGFVYMFADSAGKYCFRKLASMLMAYPLFIDL